MALQREAERRLASVKQSMPSPRIGQKRGRAADSDNEAISDEEDPNLQVCLPESADLPCMWIIKLPAVCIVTPLQNCRRPGSVQSAAGTRAKNLSCSSIRVLQWNEHLQPSSATIRRMQTFVQLHSMQELASHFG